MSLLRRIRETIKRAAGVVREHIQKPTRQQPDRKKFNAWGYIHTKAGDPKVGWYYRALIERREYTESHFVHRRRPEGPQGERFVHCGSTLDQGRNKARRERAQLKKAIRARRRKERRAA